MTRAGAAYGLAVGAVAGMVYALGGWFLWPLGVLVMGVCAITLAVMAA